MRAEERSVDTWSSYLLRMSQGDSNALSEFYDASSGLAYTVARRMVGDPGDAEEVVLDAYLKIWKAADRYDSSQGSVKTWLLTIVRRGAIDRLRKRRSHVSLGPEYLPVWIDQKPNPEMAYGLCERGAAVRRAMSEMPAKWRQTLELAYFAGMTQIEIAEVLGEPLGTVKTRVRSGLLKLRHCLSDLVYG
ncbi:MAG: sigma-70 family RNA polymerase sigma factor [Acidobacteria bacterium]|nr:sigma-70 family RNA polymerase sigma factor [Acidobacteriota bacterium]